MTPDPISTFENQDASESRVLHDTTPVPERAHRSQPRWLATALRGGAAGAALSALLVTPEAYSVVLGPLALVEGIDRAMYLRTVRLEREREEWEVDNYLAGEIHEMTDIYADKGYDRDVAAAASELLATNKDAFVDIMMVEELSLEWPLRTDFCNTPVGRTLVYVLAAAAATVMPQSMSMSLVGMGLAGPRASLTQRLVGCASGFALALALRRLRTTSGSL
mmetsp:Transcript_7848/g.25137  ORF Transcript_7848/g.25137 Transcript_7848/m.25137 type:complete len:221 (+) Transcript_7848:110-772(+)